jgi:hypothetical protein
VLSPGGATIISNPTENRWFYVYAEAANGRLWTGPFPEEVSLVAGGHCKGIGLSFAQDCGFLELDTDASDRYRFV